MRDRVDEVIEGWRDKELAVDLSPIEVILRVERIARHLDKALSDRFHARGTTLGEFDVLTALRRRGPLTPTQLVRETLASSGTITHRLDRLEEKGHVHRRPDPGDRRGIIVELTEGGTTLIDELVSVELESQTQLCAALSDEECDDLAALLKRFLSGLELRLGGADA